MIRNPLKGNEYEVAVACLKREGRVPDSFTGQDYADLWDQHSVHDWPPNSPMPLPLPDVFFPSGENAFSDEALECFNNPMKGLENP
ncbi:MAG: hypothetical protein FWD59_02015 [Micrococcales bacterium]|nr:hypothetical protein [Micrococcales bacterium]